jgi:hypothetical protein
MADQDKPRNATPAEERGVQATLDAQPASAPAPAKAPTKSQEQLDAERDKGTQAAREAELKRQEEIVKAVAETNKNLPVTGGPELNPGNPGHDFETGEPVDG